jgi:N-ethylmaleimide reductase
LFNNGAQPVAPSAIAITNDEVHTPEGKKPYVVPRELGDDELPGIVAGFKKAAQNAKVAGFDGVEVHGANGYLLDEFLRDGTNKRTGAYGGSLPNRARLLLEVIEAAAGVWGADRVGVRNSPLNSFNSMSDSDPIGLVTWLGEKLSGYGLAYWHMMRADFLGQQSGDVITAARAAYRGVLVGNMGYSPQEAADAIAVKKLDAVAFGTPFLANPDLPARVKAGAELNTPDAVTFYSPGAKGYTDYPAMAG